MSGHKRVSTTSGTGAVKCPHFLGHARKEIHCEGPEDDSRMILRYDTEDQKHRQFRWYCCDKWDHCEWHITLEEMRK